MERSGRKASRSGAGGTRLPAPAVPAFEPELDHVYRALLRHGVRASDAEDLVQDVFLIAWRRWSDFDRARPLRPWLAGIAFKVASDHLRRRGRWEPRAWLDPPDQGPGSDELLAAARARTLALRCLAALDDKQRSILVLHDLDGVSMREIADLLSVPLFTAYSRLRAARREFGRHVDQALALAGKPARRAPDNRSFPSSRSIAMPVDAAALLAAERPPPPAPVEVRRRALARLRALLLAPAGPGPASESAAGSRIHRWGADRLAAVAIGSLLAATLLWNLSPGRPAAVAPVAASAEVAPGLAAGLRLRERRLPPPALVTPPSPPAAGAVQLQRGLVGYWSFDDAGNADKGDGDGDGPPGEALDHSGNGNACRLQDVRGRPAARAQRIDGVSGRALELDGSHLLACARPEPLARLQTALSISLWARPAARRADPQVLIARQLDSSGDCYFWIALRGGSVELSSHRWKSVTRRRLPAGAGPWIHIAAVHRDSGRTALYVDGVEIGRSNRSQGVHLGGGTSVLTLGGSLDPVGVPFQGALDEVRIYDRALGSAEIHALAARPPRETARPDDKIAMSHQ